MAAFAKGAHLPPSDWCLCCARSQEELKTQLKTWEPLLYEQNGAALLLRDEAWHTRTVFEKEFCLACDWVHGTQGRTPFIKHFSECDFCHGVRNTREVRPRPSVF